MPTTRPSPRRLVPAALGRAVVGLVTLALVAFHAVLFVRRLRDLSIFEPSVALRWSGTLLLIALLAAFVRRGTSLVRGRSALAFWLLVLLLHTIPTPAALDGATPADVLVAVPASSLLAATLAVALLLTALLVRSATVTAARVAWRRRGRIGPNEVDSGYCSLLFARPPPAATLH